MNFVLAMFFGGSGLLHILVTMKQHKSLVLTSQYTHATGTALRQYSMTKLLPWHRAASKSCTMQLVHTLIYLPFGYKQVQSRECPVPPMQDKCVLSTMRYKILSNFFIMKPKSGRF